MHKKILGIAVVLSVGLFLGGISRSFAAELPKAPPWVADIPVPQNEPIYLVVKGIYASESQAQKVQQFISQLMGTIPPDRLDETDHYVGLPPGKYLVGMLFDSRERASWWIDFSYRNRKIPKGQIKRVRVRGISKLPYMPDPVRDGVQRLLSQQEALARVQALPDIKYLALRKKLEFKITDFPRNGDLRYEVEILEDKGNQHDPVMVDFVLVSALNGEITERFSRSLGRRNFAGD